MKKIIQYLALSAILPLVNGCSQKQLDPIDKQCIYPTLYESKLISSKPFNDPEPVDENRSIFYNADVLALHDSKEYYKQEVIKDNKTKRYLNELWRHHGISD
ncbi:hypothetical protein PGH07_07730 [Sulfurovum sp. zt1-1]|uniref:Lipoprotein n=1 Tax=Sulfurovum zhangzhouensis TaxID=3019067 RepID=A0ABT7QYZ3_9BACT|nr:hypothetical protein [Sulfurovum zhangzhouensis]MDM5272066.1 hypothetical protein [Sulfurovum zhangzhouensis]